MVDRHCMAERRGCQELPQTFNKIQMSGGESANRAVNRNADRLADVDNLRGVGAGHQRYAAIQKKANALVMAVKLAPHDRPAATVGIEADRFRTNEHLHRAVPRFVEWQAAERTDHVAALCFARHEIGFADERDRKSTRLNSSHV